MRLNDIAGRLLKIKMIPAGLGRRRLCRFSPAFRALRDCKTSVRLNGFFGMSERCLEIPSSLNNLKTSDTYLWTSYIFRLLFGAF